MSPAPKSPQPPAPNGPPDLENNRVLVAMPSGAPVPFRPCITQRIDAATCSFVDIGSRMSCPVRHRFELSIGDVETVQVAVETMDLDDDSHESDDDGEFEYRARAAEAVRLLRSEHAPPMPPDFSFDPFPHYERMTGEGGTLVAHLVIDEFRRRDVPKPRDGEEWFWYLDANEIPQYTAMEGLVRDLVDLVDRRGEIAMNAGSLWWVRSLHVHPRCRGHQLGGRLLGQALWSLAKGPYDLAVLEAHPEPTLFGPPGTAEPGAADWKGYQRPGRAGVDGLVRYFARMGFRRSDDPEIRFGLVQHPENDDDDALSRRLGVYGDEPEGSDAAVAMFAFLGDLRFNGGPRLGRTVFGAASPHQAG